MRLLVNISMHDIIDWSPGRTFSMGGRGGWWLADWVVAGWTFFWGVAMMMLMSGWLMRWLPLQSLQCGYRCCTQSRCVAASAAAPFCWCPVVARRRRGQTMKSPGAVCVLRTARGLRHPQHQHQHRLAGEACTIHGGGIFVGRCVQCSTIMCVCMCGYTAKCLSNRH